MLAEPCASARGGGNELADWPIRYSLIHAPSVSRPVRPPSGGLFGYCCILLRDVIHFVDGGAALLEAMERFFLDGVGVDGVGVEVIEAKAPICATQRRRRPTVRSSRHRALTSRRLGAIERRVRQLNPQRRQ